MTVMAPQPNSVMHVELPHGLTLPSDRSLVMGILNVTPDSFSDGGQWVDPHQAVEHALRMRHEGADIIDVGGESTRPNSLRISTDEEWRRIGEIVSALTEQGIVVSVDTLHACTATRAAHAGAAIINDVSGGLYDPAMNAAVAATDCAYVVQRYHGLPGSGDEKFDHGANTVAAMVQRLREQTTAAKEAGVPEQRLIVDPGLGFSLTAEQCWEIVDGIESFHELGYPVLVGASRKRFLASSPIEDRDGATVDVSIRVAAAGAWAVRVHNVAANAQALAQWRVDKTFVETAGNSVSGQPSCSERVLRD